MRKMSTGFVSKFQTEKNSKETIVKPSTFLERNHKIATLTQV